MCLAPAELADPRDDAVLQHVHAVRLFDRRHPLEDLVVDAGVVEEARAQVGVVVVAGSALPSLQWVLAFGGLAFFFWAFSRAVRPYLEKRIGLFTTILLAIIMPIVFCIVLAALPFIIWPLLS